MHIFSVCCIDLFADSSTIDPLQYRRRSSQFEKPAVKHSRPLFLIHRCLGQIFNSSIIFYLVFFLLHTQCTHFQSRYSYPCISPSRKLWQWNATVDLKYLNRVVLRLQVLYVMQTRCVFRAELCDIIVWEEYLQTLINWQRGVDSGMHWNKWLVALWHEKRERSKIRDRSHRTLQIWLFHFPTLYTTTTITTTTTAYDNNNTSL